MRTPSLRRRVVVWSVGVLAVLLLVVGVGVNFALASVLRADQEARLQSLAGLATQLTGLSDQDLADRLTMPGITARIVGSDGQEVVGVPQGPPAAGKGRGPAAGGPGARDLPAVDYPVVQSGGLLSVTVRVQPDTTVRLTADNGAVEEALDRFRITMAIASVVALAVAALLLPWVLGRALRPLSALTTAARETAAGGRGRRLDPKDPQTDLGRAAQQFDAMLEELEGAERRAGEAADRLARFLSDASHELRTPLAGVSAGAERLIRDPLTDDERDRIAVQVVREARRSARLVDDLLLVSRMGELRVEPREADLAVLLDDAAERLRARPGAAAVEVLPVAARVSVDRERTDQVLANLMVNAGHAGAAHVRLSAAVEGQEAVVRVSDDGPGIPAASREAVFERLVRLDAARSAATGGAGLGLPIARGLAEAQGGSLVCVEPGDGDLPGAVFVLRLPLVPAAPGPFSRGALSPAPA